MCEIYGFCGRTPTVLNHYTNVFWSHGMIHRDGFGYFLADTGKYYRNKGCSLDYSKALSKHLFKSKLALCHIRFKTHGDATVENCHPFIKYDLNGVRWGLIHNGYVEDNATMFALSSLQEGETDSERILLAIVEAVNRYYEYSDTSNDVDFLTGLYHTIQDTCLRISTLGKVNLIFTDSLTNNMYVFMNHKNTLHFLITSSGVHVSTTRLTNENWIPVTPKRLYIINNGVLM